MALAILSTLTGCAKFPTGPTVTGKQLVLTLKVRGRINISDPNYHYFIAIDNDGNINTGPWAVVSIPWGNGWGTSNDAARSIGITSYVQCDSSSPQSYVYGVVPNTMLQQPTSPVPPIRAELLEGGSALRVVIDLSQAATVPIPVDKIQQLDINFITTNDMPQDPYDPAVGRVWDGLGPSGQNYVNVDVTNDRLYYGYNADGPPVTDPDLEISYWSIEVQTVSSN